MAMNFALRRAAALAGKWLLRGLALFFVAAWAARFVPAAIARTDTQRDLILYFGAARAALNGGPLYTPRPDYGPDSKPFEYLYPPPFAAAIAPLGQLDWLPFARLWTVALIAACLIYACCLMRLSGRRDPWAFLSALAILIVFPGATRAVSLGQIDPLLWAIFGLSVWLAPARAGMSGALLGIASAIKIYSFWPLLALRQSENRAGFWRGALGVLALSLVVGAIVCGPASYGQWARVVLPEAAQGTFNSDNFSLSMAGLRLARAGGWHYAGGPLTGLPKAWLSLAALAGPLATLLATRRLDLRWRLALVSCAAAWCAPLCWSTYLPLALVPLALALRALKLRTLEVTAHQKRGTSAQL